MKATVGNMKRVSHLSGIIAYSPITGEEYSATPGDYWQYPDSHILRDVTEHDMILVIPHIVHSEIYL